MRPMCISLLGMQYLDSNLYHTKNGPMMRQSRGLGSCGKMTLCYISSRRRSISNFHLALLCSPSPTILVRVTNPQCLIALHYCHLVLVPRQPSGTAPEGVISDLSTWSCPQGLDSRCSENIFAEWYSKILFLFSQLSWAYWFLFSSSSPSVILLSILEGLLLVCSLRVERTSASAHFCLFICSLSNSELQLDIYLWKS